MADEIKEQVFIKIRKHLNGVGFWPADYKTFKNKLQIVVAFLLAATTSFIPGFVLTVWCFVTSPFHIRVEQTAIMTFQMICLLRVIHWVIVMPKVTKLVLDLERESFHFENFYICPLNETKYSYKPTESVYLQRKREELRKMYENRMEQVRNVAILIFNYFTLAVIVIATLFFFVSTIFHAIFNEPSHRQMAFNTYEYIDKNVTLNFIILGFQEGYINVYYGWIAAGTEIQFLTMLMFCRTQCSIIGNVVEQVPIYDFVAREIAHKQLVRCIQETNEVLMIITQMNDLLKNVIMLQDLLGIFLLCSITYSYPYFTDVYQATACIGFVVVIAFEPLILGICNTSFVEECTRIRDCMYNMKWYRTDAKFRRMVTFSMGRLHNPICIRMGDFVNADLPLFVNLLKTSYSFFTLISLKK